MSQSIFENEPKPESKVTSTDDEILASEGNKRTKKDAERDEIDANRKLKKQLADETFDFMVKVVTFIGILVGSYFAQHIFQGEKVPETVMITLLTTTFATVIGLVGFILKGLFGGETSKKKPKKGK